MQHMVKNYEKLREYWIRIEENCYFPVVYY